MGEPERVSPGSLIQGGSRSLSKVDPRSLQASAPAWHEAALNALIRNGRAVPPQQQSREEVVGDIVVPRKRFEVGARVMHRESGKRLTIIKANAGYTNKSHTPAHRVADREGNTWVVPETKLKLI